MRAQQDFVRVQRSLAMSGRRCTRDNSDGVPMTQPVDPSLFFQLTAALIPALLFGGVLARRLQPAESGRAFPPVWIFQVAVVALPAEVSSLKGALGADLAAFDIWLVTLTVVGATLVLSALLAWPDSPAHDPNPRWRTLYLPVLAVVIFLGPALGLRSAVDFASDQTVADAALRAADRNRKLDTSEDLVRARLLSGKLTRRKAGRELEHIAVERQAVQDDEVLRSGNELLDRLGRSR